MNKKILFFSISFLILLISCSPITEHWELVNVLSDSEVTRTYIEYTEVRYCTSSPEQKEITCAAGTSNEFTTGAVIQGGGSIGTGITGGDMSVSSEVAAALGFNRGSEESMPLDVPPQGYIYIYPVEKNYSIVNGQLEALSSEGNRAIIEYTYDARCSMTLQEKQITTCDGTPVDPANFQQEITSATNTPLPSELEETNSSNPPPETLPSDQEDPLLYDGFDDSTFDEIVNTELWVQDFSESCHIHQRSGVMVFENTPPETGVDCLLTVRKPSKVPAEEIKLFEADIRLSEPKDSNVANQGLFLVTKDLDGGYWFAFCGISSNMQKALFVFDISNYGDGNKGDIYHTAPASYDQWYNFRMEIDPETMLFSCYIDNNLFSSIIPSDADELRNVYFERHLDAWRTEGSLATSYVDNVRIDP